MRYNLSNPYHVQRLTERLEAMKAKGAIVDLTEQRKKRSLPQNNYLHLLLSYFASVRGENVRDIKLNVFKLECNPDIFIRDITYNGEQLKYIRSTSELDTAEMSLAIDRFINRSFAHYSIPLPSPEDERFVIECEHEIERNKEFLYT